jgi:SulP family sulfate permease
MTPAALSNRIRHLLYKHRGNVRDDLIAGLTVSLIAIPQSLAYAQLAGLPAYYGLYAALVPTVVGALVGSSKQLSTGPVAMTSLLTAASVAQLVDQSSEAYVTYVVLLALLSGVFQIAFGLMRIGVLLNFLSHPVLMGFINAAALIIGLSQLPAMLGITVVQSDHFLIDIWGALLHVDAVHMLSAAFGIGTIILLFGFRRFAPRLPGVLVTVAALTAVSWAVGYAAEGGRVVGDVPRGLPSFSMPPLDLGASAALLPAAFVIALVSFMEAMSSAKVIAIRTRQPWDENRELIGQGLAKVASALSHSMPVSGSFSRSAMNLACNARTPMASVFSACFVLVALLLFTPLLYHLPKPVLAGIIMTAVVGLINFRALAKAWRADRDDGIAAIATFVSTLAFAPHIQNGIVAGIMLSLALLLYRLMRPRVVTLVVHADGSLTETSQAEPAQLLPGLGAIRFDGDLRFMNVSYFEDALLKLESSNSDLRCILVKASAINYIDASGVEAVTNLVERFAANGLTLAFSGIKRQVRQVMDRTGLPAIVGENNIFATDREAIESLRVRLKKEPEEKPAGNDGSGKESAENKPAENTASGDKPEATASPEGKPAGDDGPPGENRPQEGPQSPATAV